MKFQDIALLSDDIQALASFYEQVFQIDIERNAQHMQFEVGGFSMALCAKEVAVHMGFDLTRQGTGTGMLTMGFWVDDVDSEYIRLKGFNIPFETQPTSQPWGVRSFHFRDPDGNILCFRGAV